jgi:hypothetical protein
VATLPTPGTGDTYTQAILDEIATPRAGQHTEPQPAITFPGATVTCDASAKRIHRMAWVGVTATTISFSNAAAGREIEVRLYMANAPTLTFASDIRMDEFTPVANTFVSIRFRYDTDYSLWLEQGRSAVQSYDATAIGSVAKPGTVIASTVYNPSSLTTLDGPASTADADIDSTNLKVTGTVPATGRLRVRMIGTVAAVTASANIHWMLRKADGTTVAGTKACVATLTSRAHTTHDALVTGLTPGAAFEYRWGCSSDNASNKARLYCGDAGGTLVHGPAQMIVTVG